MGSRIDLILVGASGEEHIGTHLRHAAAELGLRVKFLDTAQVFGNRWLDRLLWRVNGHRPARLRQFGREVHRACLDSGTRWLLTTGLAPIESDVLESIGTMGIQRINYLSDDPWNRVHRAPWFIQALRHYDHVFSARRSNLDDLRRAGCPDASYLPFAYSPRIHYPVQLTNPEERQRFSSDVLFVGGADRDRVPLIRTLLRSRFSVALYGDYWKRYPATRPSARGYATSDIFRKAIAGAKVNLCLVRRANRDGNAMRSFEIPAMGGCLLAEDTEEHREIFGPEGEAVLYFLEVYEMIEKLRWLLDHEEERRRLAENGRLRITRGKHTYQDRLKTMVKG